MKNTILLLIIFIPTLTFVQGDNIKGKWILHYVTYEDGNPLEIVDLLFIIFKSIEILDDHIIIHGISNNKATIYDGRISTRYLKYKYYIDNKYLVLKGEKDDKLYYYLSVIDFKFKYPESKPSRIEYEG